MREARAPDPQSETLIGYSKRLAFPTYRDEGLLRRVLREARLDSRADFRSVNAAVYSSISLFGASFKEEASAFNSLIARGLNQAAYDSPFWGAVRDITLEAEEEGARKHGRFCLQLDASDPQSPELILLVDEVAGSIVGTRFGRRLPRPRGDYTHVWTGDGGQTSIEALLSLAGRHGQFAQSKVGRSLAMGVLALFPDSLGNMASDGEFSDRGPAAFVLREDIAPLLESISKHLGLKWSDARDARVLGGWRVFSYDSLSQACLDRFANELPDGNLSIGSGWRPPQPRIAGAARLGQAVFLNPASNPFVRMDGATTGRYQLLREEGVEAAAGELAADEEGFYIPPGLLVGIGRLVACRYVLVGPDGLEAMLEMPVVTEVPTGTPRGLQREAWLIEGSSGVLEGVECLVWLRSCVDSWPSWFGHRLGSEGTLPRFRTHVFLRAIEGLFVAPLPAPTSLERDERARRIFSDLTVESGERYGQRKHDGRMARRVDLLYCECCGTLFLGGKRSGALGSGRVELLPNDPDTQGMPERAKVNMVEQRSAEDYSIFMPTMERFWPLGTGEISDEDAQGRWREAEFDPFTATISAISPGADASAERVPGWEYVVGKGKNFRGSKERKQEAPDAAGTALPFQCPACGTSYRYGKGKLSPIRGFRVGFAKTTQLLASVLMGELQRTNGGERLVTFSDSRQDAAKAAFDLEGGHHDDVRREIVVRALDRIQSAKKTPSEIEARIKETTKRIDLATAKGKRLRAYGLGALEGRRAGAFACNFFVVDLETPKNSAFQAALRVHGSPPSRPSLAR